MRRYRLPYLQETLEIFVPGVLLSFFSNPPLATIYFALLRYFDILIKPLFFLVGGFLRTPHFLDLLNHVPQHFHCLHRLWMICCFDKDVLILNICVYNDFIPWILPISHLHHGFLLQLHLLSPFYLVITTKLLVNINYSSWCHHIIILFSALFIYSFFIRLCTSLIIFGSFDSCSCLISFFLLKYCYI